MNQLTQLGNTEKTMSSLELRDIINAARAEHGESKVENSHFLKRIEDELEGELGGSKNFRHPQSGAEMRYYDLTRDQCTLVGMRESKGVRRNVLAKLKELELKSQLNAIPKTRAELLRYAADLEEEKQVALEQLEAAKPAVEFVGRYVKSSSGSMNFRQVAKALEIKENVFRKFLVDNHIMYQQGGSWLPYANHVDAGRFEVKTGSSNGHSFAHSKFTAKGVNWIAEQLGREVAA